jgi:sugar O-acyltransferase (sialic acid O-acetyltransferase NeuD family)
VTDVVLFGTGELADILATYLTVDSPHRVVGFSQDGSHIVEESHLGLPIVAFETLERRFPPGEVAMIIAITFKEVNRLRAARFDAARERGYRLLSYVSSRAITWPDLVLGDNCVIMEGTVIQPNVVIGDDVIIGPANCIGHHSRLGDHSFIASQVSISGHVTVGPYAFLGANATVRDGATIGARSVIGAGATILTDTQEGAVFTSPAAQRYPLTSDKLPRI